jgi:hypothetical protein
MTFSGEFRRSIAVALFVLIVGFIGTIVLLPLVSRQHEVLLSSLLLDNIGMLASSLGRLQKRRSLALKLEQHDQQSNHNQHRNEQQQKQQQQPDATFNGIPLVYRQGKPRSSVYCIEEGVAGRRSYTGQQNNENHSNVSWMFRSCRFDYLCFDTKRQDYVLFRNGESNDKNHHSQQSMLFSMDLPPDNWTLAVALGGINPRWLDQLGFDKGAWKVRWFPTILPAAQDNTTTLDEADTDVGYYTLPDNHVLVPFHSFAGHNVGML